MRETSLSLVGCLCVFCFCLVAACGDSEGDGEPATTDTGADVEGDVGTDVQSDTSTPPDLSVEASVDGSVGGACTGGGGTKSGNFDISGTVTNEGTQTASNIMCEFTAEATSSPPEGTLASGTLLEDATLEGMEETSLSGQFMHDDGCDADYDISVTVECFAESEAEAERGEENTVTTTASF